MAFSIDSSTHSLCFVLVYEGTCLLQGKDLVLHFEKQLKVREEAQ